MPSQITPPRSFLSTIQRAMGSAPQFPGVPVAETRGTQEFTGISNEIVSQLPGDGRVIVQSFQTPLPVTGVNPAVISVGDQVVVGWKGGEPKAVLFHTARRAQFAVSPPLLGGAVVEELYFDASIGVWFRNGDQMVQLITSAGLPTGTVTLTNIRWGKFSPNYFVLENTGSAVGINVVVYRLNRPKDNEPFPPGFRITATEFARYNLGALSLSQTFGSVALAVVQTAGAFNASTAISYYRSATTAGPLDPNASIIFSPLYAAVAENGDLLIKINHAAVITSLGGINTFGSLIVNAKTGVVLAWTNPALISWAGSSPAAASFTFTSPAGFSSLTVAEAGLIVTESFKMTRVGDTSIPAMNNYMKWGPAYIIQAPAPAPQPTFTVVGEFAQAVPHVAFPTDSEYLIAFQGGRTKALWTRQGSGQLNLADFRRRLQAQIGTNPDAVFGAGPPLFPDLAITNRQLVATEADLIYKPLDTVAPFTNTFFVKQGTATQITLNQATLRRENALRTAGTLTRPRSPAAIAVIAASLTLGFSTDLQVLDSKLSLGSFFLPPPPPVA